MNNLDQFQAFALDTATALNPCLANVPILCSLKTTETFGFLVFSGGIKWAHWPEMGKEAIRYPVRKKKHFNRVQLKIKKTGCYFR